MSQQWPPPKETTVEGAGRLAVGCMLVLLAIVVLVTVTAIMLLVAVT